MNKDQLQGKWKQLKGKVKEQWGKLTDDDLDIINGQRDQLEGRLQMHYGKTREQITRDVDRFLKSCASEADLSEMELDEETQVHGRKK